MVAGSQLLAAFRSDGGRVDRVLLALFLLINGTVLLNALLHPPSVGYDSRAHLRYIGALSRFEFPTEEDTYEFFSPPLPYLLPAAFFASGLLSPQGVGKLAQLVNVVYSLGLTFCVLKTCDLMRPGAPAFKRDSLLLLGMLPVYYKTFALVRPEPLLAWLWVLVVLQTLRVFVKGRLGFASVAGLGVLLGLLILARQQGFFWILALLLFACARLLGDREARPRILKAVAGSLIVAFVVGGWFYLRLHVKYGSSMAYAKARPPFSLANQPPEFYVGLGDGKLFDDPVRPAFRNQLLPTLYSETWGDYGCYFLVSGFDRRSGTLLYGGDIEKSLGRRRAQFWLETNRLEMGRYLGRVNLVSLFPSAVLLGGFLLGCASLARTVAGAADERAWMSALVVLGVLVSLGSYLVLLVAHASQSGNMIKATYLIPVFPLLALLGADLLERVRGHRPRAYRGLLVVLALAAAHNSLACVTSYRAV